MTILVLALATAAGDGRADEFAQARLDNWHQWRGPMATGVAPHGDPPVEWDEKTNVKWKIEIPGEGSATPIVWEDRVFLLSAIKTERAAETAPRRDFRQRTRLPGTYYRFVVTCVAGETGKILWHQLAREEVPHEGRHPTNSYASASPTTDGRRVYASFGSRGVYCYDLSGKFQWKRNLGDMRTRYGWGEATSPVIHGDRLVVNWDHEDQSFIVVLDAKTGETKWKVDRDEPTSWATPLVVEHEGRSHVVVNGTNRVRSYDLASGRVIWQSGGLTLNAIPSPIITGSVVICMSGYRGAVAYAISLDSTGDLTESAKILWSHDQGTPYVPSPIVYGDRVFFTSRNSTILSCLDARTGKPLADARRLPGLSGDLYASPVGAAGRIYFVARGGTTLVIKNSHQLEALAVNELDDRIDASPAIVGKKMFLRGRNHLYCIEAD